MTPCVCPSKSIADWLPSTKASVHTEKMAVALLIFFLCSLLTVDGFIAGLARPLIFSALFLLLLLLLLMFSIRRTFGFGRGLDI